MPATDQPIGAAIACLDEVLAYTKEREQFGQKISSFQLTRAITRDPRFTDVPVIMCTSKNQETDRVWGMRQGARDYVVKPVNPDELMSKIKAFG